MIDTNELERAVDETAPDFSGVVAVRLSADTSPFVIARGLAHRPTDTPNRVSTRFGIASGTKGFTAAATLHLVSADTISLETRLEEVLPGRFPGFAPEITIEHLLTHTSGVPDYCDEELGCDFEALWVDRPVYAMRTIEDFVPMFGSEPMKFAPGERFSYSNSGFLLLGLIIERLTGKRYIDYVTETLFDELGMTASGFFASDTLPPDTATGYVEENGTFRSNIFAIPVIGSADGGAFSTAADLFVFWDSLFNHRLLSPGILTRLIETCIDETDESHLGYSLGFWRADRGSSGLGGPDGLFVLIGSDPGVSFVSGYDPQTGGGYVTLSNSDSGAFKLTTMVKHMLSDHTDSRETP